jgi:molybdate transport system substrate-binding protein
MLGRSPTGRAIALAGAGLLAVLPLSGCDDDESGEVVVLAASSLTDAFTELADAFERTRPDLTVRLGFGGSSSLATQAIEGAPADVFAAADDATMQRLVGAGVVAGEPTVFATNRAAIVVEAGNPHDVTGLDDLDDRGGLVVVTCAPQVPCGAYAEEIVERAGVEVTPASLEANVRSVATKVALGEADAGIVYVTDLDAFAADTDGVEIAPDDNVVARYPIAVLGPTRRAAATAFVDFATSDEASSILRSHGFGPP